MVLHARMALTMDFKALNIIILHSASSLSPIDVTDVSAPLYLQYRPSMGSTPIHEIAEGHNNHIKRFY